MNHCKSDFYSQLFLIISVNQLKIQQLLRNFMDCNRAQLVREWAQSDQLNLKENLCYFTILRRQQNSILQSAHDFVEQHAFDHFVTAEVAQFIGDDP